MRGSIVGAVRHRRARRWAAGDDVELIGDVPFITVHVRFVEELAHFSLQPTLPAPKTRSTILGRSGARSVCRMTLRYHFLHGARNLIEKWLDRKMR
jgi:hypothetical protein